MDKKTQNEKEHKTMILLTGDFSKKVEERAKELNLGKSIVVKLALGEYFKNLETKR